MPATPTTSSPADRPPSPVAKAFIKHGLPGYTFSPNAYMEAGLIWNGKHPEDNSELVVIQGAKKGVPYPVLEEEP